MRLRLSVCTLATSSTTSCSVEHLCVHRLENRKPKPGQAPIVACGITVHRGDLSGLGTPSEHVEQQPQPWRVRPRRLGRRAVALPSCGATERPVAVRRGHCEHAAGTGRSVQRGGQHRYRGRPAEAQEAEGGGWRVGPCGASCGGAGGAGWRGLAKSACCRLSWAETTEAWVLLVSILAST